MPVAEQRSLASRVLAGDRRAAARLITLIENRDADAVGLLATLHARTGNAYRIGFTGPPGAGKSSLVDRLITRVRGDDLQVGVIAVDPASPFSGGAILGDRVRMANHAADPGVFIRSMSARGHLGGLALATQAAARVLDALGCDVVIVETVGVGQSEVAIARSADATVLVLPPGLGDGVQALKAGIMEIPDLFVVNKADLPGAGQVAKEIEALLALGGTGSGSSWTPPVIMTKSLSPTPDPGTDALWQALRARREHLVSSGELSLKRHHQATEEIRAEAEELLHRQLTTALATPEGRAILESAVSRELPPHDAALRMLEILRRTP